jgi:hypothetical protein
VPYNTHVKLLHHRWLWHKMALPQRHVSLP